LGILSLFVAGFVLVTMSVAGQNTTAPKAAAPKAAPKAAAPASTAKAAASKAAPAPRTSWGQPDLHGTWFVFEAVPMERSAANANRQFLTDEEVAAADKQKAAAPGRNTRQATGAQDAEGAYNAVFNSILKTSKRTAMIIDPEDGRIPPLTAEAQARRGGRGGGGRGGGGGGGARGGGRGGAALAPGTDIYGSTNAGPETTAIASRCLGVQMPFLPNNTAFAQGTVMQIVQGPKSMAIYMEDDHAGGGNRVIQMDGSPHPPKNVKKFLGDSRGRWEGNTLVVETTNFINAYNGANPDTFKMTERFTRVDANRLNRQITFEDPETWSRPWTLLIEMAKTDDRRHMIFDSACHEGNYGLVGILAGARKEEADAAAKK
jgi:hypothetical protein